jgi:hypothetical protein
MLANCELRYKIVLHWSSLTVALTMKNTGDVVFPVQALLRTYYLIHDKAALDPTKCYVRGLQEYELVDKVDASNSTCNRIEPSDDEVYVPPESKLRLRRRPIGSTPHLQRGIKTNCTRRLELEIPRRSETLSARPRHGSREHRFQSRVSFGIHLTKKQRPCPTLVMINTTK